MTLFKVVIRLKSTSLYYKGCIVGAPGAAVKAADLRALNSPQQPLLLLLLQTGLDTFVAFAPLHRILN